MSGKPLLPRLDEGALSEARGCKLEGGVCVCIVAGPESEVAEDVAGPDEKRERLGGARRPTCEAECARSWVGWWIEGGASRLELEGSCGAVDIKLKTLAFAERGEVETGKVQCGNCM